MPTPGWLRQTDLPLDAAGRRYIDPANLDQILDQFANWRADVNAGGHKLTNVNFDASGLAATKLEVANPAAPGGYIDLSSDAAYPDYGLRLQRQPSGYSGIFHRGTGEFQLYSQEAGPIVAYVNTVNKLRIGNSRTTFSSNYVAFADPTNAADEPALYGQVQITTRQDAGGAVGSAMAFVKYGTSQIGLGWHNAANYFGFGTAVTNNTFAPNYLRFDPANAGIARFSNNLELAQVLSGNVTWDGSQWRSIAGGAPGWILSRDATDAILFTTPAVAAGSPATLIESMRFRGADGTVLHKTAVSINTAPTTEAWLRINRGVDSGIDALRIYGASVAAGYTALNADGANKQAVLFFYDGAAFGTLRIYGKVAMSNLPSSRPAPGLLMLWYDPADSNRVKFEP